MQNVHLFQKIDGISSWKFKVQKFTDLRIPSNWGKLVEKFGAIWYIKTTFTLYFQNPNCSNQKIWALKNVYETTVIINRLYKNLQLLKIPRSHLQFQNKSNYYLTQ